MLSSKEHVKPTVLVVDDETGPRDALKVILQPFFNIRSAENAASALAVVNTQPIDLIALDQQLPDRHGIDLLQDIKHEHADIEVIIITGHGSVESAMEGFSHGAAGYLLKPFNVTELMTLVNHTLEKKRRLDLIRRYFRSCSGLWGSEQEASASWHMLKTECLALDTETHGSVIDQLGKHDRFPFLSDILEATDSRLFHHSIRVSSYAALMGARINLTHDMHHALMLGAFLHDIGKVHPALCKSAAEWTFFSRDKTVHKEHPLAGARLTHALGLPEAVRQVVLYHHERWDGQGFPHGLAGEDIPILARIVSLAQTFDHLTVDIPGRSPISPDEALRTIEHESHTQFDPLLADIFREVLSQCKTTLVPKVHARAQAFSEPLLSPIPSTIH